MKIIKIDPIRPEEENIDKAVSLLKNGKIVAFPTDTVYGLGVNAENKTAIDKLYKVKGRTRNKPFILFLEEKESFIFFAQLVSLSAQRLINRFWPGPLTLLFKANKASPASLVSKEGKIGLRFPDHPIPRKIMKKGEILLATTSANPSGASSPSTLRRLDKTLAKNIDLILDGGKTSRGKESSIVDVASQTPRLIREGWLPSKLIEQTLKKEGDILFVCTGNTCRSPTAEAIAKKLWQGKGKGRIKIHSAGTVALSGFRTAPLSIKTMGKRGIRMDLHRSTPLNEEMVEEADLILVMERKHKKQILHFSPFAEGKVFLLKHFALGIEEEIPDPIGGSEEDYQECAREIEESLRGLMWKLSAN